MRIITMYLPQYHVVKENSEWWGEGYTDWVAVKQAEPLYEGHVQPRIPKDNRYYNLLEKDTMEWQADLMHQYGIDGVCMYHYWFKDGRRILEQPAENLLQWKDINMPFCFYWDSQSWVRSWSKLSESNAWADKFEAKESIGERAVLLEQDYGNEKQWKQHFEYLLPFFRDERYIRINDRPVFMFYRTASIGCIKQMTQKWNEWAKEQGLRGIYFIGANGDIHSQDVIDANIFHEPAHIIGEIGTKRDKKDEPGKVPYDEVWGGILKSRRTLHKTYYSGFVGYDDTPRRECVGTVIEGQTPEKFQKYLAELLAKNEVFGNEITFLNAWNEWGECMYLEPDEKDGEKYLQAVLSAKGSYKEYIPKYIKQYESFSNEVLLEITSLQSKCDKYQYLWRAMDKWMLTKEKKIQLSEYFLRKGIRTIGIYGFSKLGRHLFEELKETDVKVVFGIDQNREIKNVKIPIYSIEEDLPKVDAIILTMAEGKYLSQILSEKIDCCIMSLEELLDDCLKKI